MTARSYLLLAAGALLACQRQQAASGTTTGASAALVPHFDSLAPPRVVDSSSARIQKPSGTKTVGQTSATKGKLIPPGLKGPKGGDATVATVLDSPELVGRVVRVTGRCLGYATTQGLGSPPSSRSDWVLQAGGRSVYVVGAFPAGCTGASPSAGDVTIAARVSQDTLAGFGSRPGQPRRYLVVAR